MKNEYLEAGRFNGTHGIKGDIKAECWCDDFSVLRNLTKVYLKEKNGYRALRIRRCVPYRDLALLHIEGYENPEDASVLKNRVFFAKREDLPLEEGSFFIADLLGLRVYDADTGRIYGEIADVSENAASQLYEVKTPEGKTVYLPAVKEFIAEIDMERGVGIRPAQLRRKCDRPGTGGGIFAGLCPQYPGLQRGQAPPGGRYALRRRKGNASFSRAGMCLL